MNPAVRCCPHESRISERADCAFLIFTWYTRQRAHMTERPPLTKDTDAGSFMENAYRKDEMILFCIENGLQTRGSEAELTERIFVFLSTGIKMIKGSGKRELRITFDITLDSLIEKNIIFTEAHRKFFQKHIGRSFWFWPDLQVWMRDNPGRTYGDAVAAYREQEKERAEKRNARAEEFDHVAYLRDFMNDNPERTPEDAERCWCCKNGSSGNRMYERNDLSFL